MDDLKVEAFDAKSIRMTRSLRASRAMVFKAWTTPKLVRQWLLGPGDRWSMPVCEIDLRIGGSYRFQWKNDDDGSVMGIRGEYREIVPGERLVTTETFDEAWYKGSAVITLTLAEHDDVTVVVQIVEYDSAETRDGVMRSPMESGVRASFHRMDALLAT